MFFQENLVPQRLQYLASKHCTAPHYPRKTATTNKMSKSAVSDLIRESLTAVSQGQLPTMDVLKPLISKGLGYGILAGACVTKLPQISAIMNSKSAAGLSIVSCELEIVGFLIASAYGYILDLPFSAYGEATILLLQSIVLVAAVYKYARVPITRPLFTGALFAGASAYLGSGTVTMEMVQALYVANNGVFMAARVPQIISNFRTKATGQLSLATNAINLLGCVVRIFTTMQEKAGAAMLYGFIIATFLNLTLVLQILMYGPKKQPKAKAA